MDTNDLDNDETMINSKYKILIDLYQPTCHHHENKQLI